MKTVNIVLRCLMALLLVTASSLMPLSVAAAEEATALTVTWNFGYVGSSSNGGGYANKLAPNQWYYSYTDVITIEKAGTKIYFTDSDMFPDKDKGFASGSAYVFSSWKQENGEWVIDLSRGNYAGNASEICTPGDGSMTYTYVTSSDNENIRICYRSGERSGSDPFTPETHPVIYAQYTGETGTSDPNKADPLTEWLEASKKDYYNEALKGLTMNVIGDSYFAGHTMDPKYVWPSLLAQKYEMTFKNYGINGSSISDYTTNNNPMVSRYSSMVDNDPDIIIIEGGKNDYNILAPIGTNSDTTSKTFKGAVNVLIDGIKEKYPNAFIVCVTVWEVDQTNGIGKKVADYGKAMMEVCAAKGVPCFDATDIELSGVNMNDAAFRAEYCLSATDISHLNEKGHKLAMPNFERFIAEEYVKFLAGGNDTSDDVTDTSDDALGTTDEATESTENTTDAPVTTDEEGDDNASAEPSVLPWVIGAVTTVVGAVLGFLVGRKTKPAS